MNLIAPAPIPLQTCDEVDMLPVDILDRQRLLDQLMDLFDALSSSESSCTFALNGKWGSGKTFVIERLEHYLKRWQDGSKYLVFHYNCWQYDYYEEPLIAIVSAMIDNISNYTHFFSKKSREKIKQVGRALKKIGVAFVEKKIDFNIGDLSATNKENNYDIYYDFKKAMDKTRKELLKLSQDQTLVIVVDELDRCLPNYAIKVLERLHHLFSNLQNTVLLLATDKDQLNQSVKYIFGEETDTNAFLKKFIDFEVALNIGNVNASFRKKFIDYVEHFDESAMEIWSGIDDYLATLFVGIDIRTQEHIIKRAQTIHQILFKDEKKDYSYLCFELLLTILSKIDNLPSDKAPIYYLFRNGRYSLHIDPHLPETLLEYIKQNWNFPITTVFDIHGQRPIFARAFDASRPIHLSIPQLMFIYAEGVYDMKNGIYSNELIKNKCEKPVHDLKRFNQLLNIIE